MIQLVLPGRCNLAASTPGSSVAQPLCLREKHVVGGASLAHKAEGHTLGDYKRISATFLLLVVKRLVEAAVNRTF
jgi:hypothetical protein